MGRPVAPAAAPAAGGAPPAPGRGGGLLAKIGGSRNGAILAAGATVAGVGLLTVLRGKQAPVATPVQAGGDGFDSGPYDMWEQWQQEYDGLAGRVSTLENPPTPTTTPKPPPASDLPKPPPSWAPIPAPPVAHPPIRVAPPIKAPATKTYVVKKGDTLSGIAKKLGITMAKLKKLNPVYWTNPKYKNGNEIWSGDKVKY